MAISFHSLVAVYVSAQAPARVVIRARSTLKSIIEVAVLGESTDQLAFGRPTGSKKRKGRFARDSVPIDKSLHDTAQHHKQPCLEEIAFCVQ